jgi:hypothetical protein
MPIMGSEWIRVCIGSLKDSEAHDQASVVHEYWEANDEASIKKPVIEEKKE